MSGPFVGILGFCFNCIFVCCPGLRSVCFCCWSRAFGSIRVSSIFPVARLFLVTSPRPVVALSPIACRTCCSCLVSIGPSPSARLPVGSLWLLNHLSRLSLLPSLVWPARRLPAPVLIAYHLRVLLRVLGILL